MSKEFKEKTSSLMLPAGKSKILHEFIKDVAENDVNKVLSECKDLPSFQYCLLKLALADKFQRFDLALELLHNEEKAIVSNTARKPWLYDTKHKLVGNSEYLLNDFFPSVSYSCRQKVLNNIGLYTDNEKQVNIIFDDVEKKYGFNAAAPLIEGCTKEKIQLILLKRKLILKSHQINRIIERFPDIGLQYLKDRYPILSKREEFLYQSTLNYLFSNHPNDFIELFIANHKTMTEFKIGRCRSKKIIKAFRSKVLEYPTVFANVLNIDQMRKEFKREEFMLLFESTFPKSIDDYHRETLWKWLNTFKKSERLEVITNVYMKLYQINLDDHPEYISGDIIFLLPVERLLSVIDWKSKNESSSNCNYYKKIYVYTYNQEAIWSMFKPIEYSVPELEKALTIEQQTIRRASLSKCLILTCYMNDDLSKLLYVLNLLNKISRNDQLEIRSEIFQTITDIMNDMKLTEDHWCIILEIVKTSLVFDKYAHNVIGNQLKIVEKCLATQMKSKKLMENIFSFLLKLKLRNPSYNWTWPEIKSPTDGNTFFEFYVKELESLYSTLKTNNKTEFDVSKLHELSFDFIHHISKFNREQRKTSANAKCIFFSDNDWVTGNIERIFESQLKGVYNAHDKRTLFTKMYDIVRELRSEQRKSLNASYVWDDLFSRILVTAPTEEVLMHYLHENPVKLDDSWPIVLSQMLTQQVSCRFIRKIKSCNYSSLKTQSVKMCTEIIHSMETSVKQKCNAIIVLSILSDAESFLSLGPRYYPFAPKINVFADDSEEDYQLKWTYVKSLVEVNSSFSALSATEKFCVGDYLKLTVGTLCSHLIRISETDAVEFLRPRLYVSRVSLQKHVIRLFFEISTLNDQMEALSNMNSHNVAIRHEIFLRAKSVFIANPTHPMWNLLKRIMENVSIDDVPTLKYIYSTPRISEISKEFVSDYILLCLATLKVSKDSTRHINLFLDNVNEEIDKTAEEVLDNIVLNYYGSGGFNIRFLIRYLVKSKNLQNCDHRISNIQSYLKNVIAEFSNKLNSEALSTKCNVVTRDTLFEFINNLCKDVLNGTMNIDLKKKILEDIISLFESQFLSVVFKGIFHMKLALLLIPITEQKPAEKLKLFGRSFGKLIDQFTEVYGTEITPIIHRETEIFINSCLSAEIGNKEIIVEIVDGILETSSSRASRIVCSEFLRNINPKSVTLKATYDRVMEFLKNSDDAVVKIFYHY